MRSLDPLYKGIRVSGEGDMFWSMTISGERWQCEVQGIGKGLFL